MKPVEPTKSPPKTSRKRKTRTSLNAAGISTWQAGQANTTESNGTPEVKPEVEETKPEMSVKDKLLSALGLIQKSDKTPDDKPAKKLPIFIPEKCPTFGGDLGMFKFDLIETVECSGRADYFQPPADVKLEIREPEDHQESPTPTPKPKPERAASKPKSSRSSNPRRTARNSNNSSPQIKEEPKEEVKKEQEPPPMPSPAKKVKKEPIQARVEKIKKSVIL